MKVTPFIRAPYNYDPLLASDESGLECADGSLTIQSQAEEADINVIVRRFGVTGQLPEAVRAPTYGDFTDIVDFRTAMDAVNDATASFRKMDASVRNRFSNDPQLFVEFCSDPANVDEMVRLGLAIPKALSENQVVANGLIVDKPPKEAGVG